MLTRNVISGKGANMSYEKCKIDEKCDVPVFFRLRRSERDELNQEGRPLAAVLRERLGFDPALPGRRWPAPAERQQSNAT
jgi:hypothetical protein